MTKRPIILKADEVQALLTGRVVIEREMEPQPRLNSVGVWQWERKPGLLEPFHPLFDPEAPLQQYPGGGPHGRPGQRLWIRETFSSPRPDFVAYKATAECGAWMDDGEGGRLWLRHGYILESPAYLQCFQEPAETYGLAKYGGRWRSPATMPRSLSRKITAENVGVEVVQVDGVWKWRTTLERVDE